MEHTDGKCPRCGVQQVVDSQAGPCPGCLLKNALGSPAPVRIGDYDIVGVLGRGGMGVIYCAKQRSTGRVVALKVIQAGKLATKEERQRFRAEIKAAQVLDHPNIVAIDDVGDYAGCPYYTMRVYPGVLAEEMKRFQAPMAAAALVELVARAVHHGHIHGVLHRDLKPANILLDEQDRPHVGDFGTAKHLGEPDLTATGVVVGTPMYMAPEQASGSEQAITTRADIYSLGAILYELLVGRPPFVGDDVSILHALRDKDKEPVSPRVRDTTVPDKLETICLKCLKKEPTSRYRTAEDLADDLKSFMRGEPIVAQPPTFGERVWRFTQRHWLATGVGMGTTLLLAIVAATAISVAHTQERELGRETLWTNSHVAGAFADSVSLHLQEQIDVLKKHTDKAIESLRGSNRTSPCPDPVEPPTDPVEPPAGLKPYPGDDVLVGGDRAFDSVGLFDQCGTVIAFTSNPHVDPNTMKLHYYWRDYFIGAKKHGEKGLHEGYVSRAFLAEYDHRYQFAIAVPIYDGDRWMGVASATISTKSAWGRPALHGWSDESHRVILVAPLDRERATSTGPSEYIVLQHDTIVPGSGHKVKSPRLSEFSVGSSQVSQPPSIESRPVIDDDFHDPLSGVETRWLAGLAPVDNTPFLVIVETRYDAAVKANAQLTPRLVWRITAVIIGWSIGFGFAMWGYARRRRRARMVDL